MTEQEWQISCDPIAMFAVAENGLNERQKRLFAVVCCRRINEYLNDDQRAAVSVLEAYADGRVGAGELLQAHRNVSGAVPKLPRRSYHAAQAVVKATAAKLSLPSVLNHGALSAGHNALQSVFDDASLEEPSLFFDNPYRVLLRERYQDEAFIQAILLRDFTGNLHRPVTFSEEWRNPTVMALAREINAKQSFLRLPKLATALEQAGCTEASVLDHCRNMRMHARGCWVLEGLLAPDEAEWPILDLSPFRLLEWLWLRGRISERKLRLFGLACFRKADPEVPDVCRQGLEVAERFANEEATGKELWDAEEKISYWIQTHIGDTQEQAARVVSVVAGAIPLSAATVPLRLCRLDMDRFGEHSLTFIEWLLAELLGNPFRISVHYPWLNSSVRAMAKTINQERDFAALPILADLLEDSDCSDPAIIGHLRGPGPHVRGCWALDLLLGQK